VSHAAPPRQSSAGLRAVDLRNLPMLLVIALGTTGIAYSAAVPRHWLRGVLLLAFACAVAGRLPAAAAGPPGRAAGGPQPAHRRGLLRRSRGRDHHPGAGPAGVTKDA
jgi:hypothetical protein